MTLTRRTPLYIVSLLACALACASRPARDEPSSASASASTQDPGEGADGGAEAKANPVLERLEHRRANHPEDGASRYALARYYAREQRLDDALAALQELVANERWDYPLNAEDFPALAGDPAFARVVTELSERAPNVPDSAVAFELDALDILPEGVAWDARRGALLVGSTRQRKVLVADAEGRTRELVKSAQDGLLGVLGMDVDGARDQLWVASATPPFMEGFDPEQHAGASALYAFDLETGATVGRWEPPEKPAQFNDVAALRDGAVYVTDSVSGALLERAPDAAPGAALRRVTPRDAFLGANGLVAAPGEAAIFVCDFFGVSRYERGDGALRLIDPPPGVLTLGGVDGLARRGSTLVAIQNLFTTGRVWAIELSEDGRSFTRATILDDAHPRHKGPTTGAIAGDRFLYLANASLQLEGMELKPAPAGARHVILSIPLP